MRLGLIAEIRGMTIMMEELAAAMLAYTEQQTGDSPFVTPIPTMAIIRSDRPKPPAHRLAQPAMCIVAQGAKWANFGDERLEYRAGEALVIGVETPSLGTVSMASPERPCLVLAFELDLGIMRAVAAELPAPPHAGKAGRGVFVVDVTRQLTDCALRLVRLIDTPEAIPVLYPAVMREICYWLLTGPQAADMAAMALANTPSQRVIEAMHWMRDHFAEPMRVDDAAAVAKMSPSAFHRQFKALTGLSPLQYQKQMRLLEARRLLALRATTVEAAAFTVGYESPSQFSREYARLFGEPPRRDLKRLMASADLVGDQARGVA